MASSTGIAADPTPTPAPGSPVPAGGPRGDDAPVAPRPPDGAGATRGRRAPGNPAAWRVRTKLIAILAIPVAAILINASIEASSVLNSTRGINRVQHLTEINRSGIKLLADLERERTFTVSYVAAAMDPTSTPNINTVKARRVAVDEAYQAYQNVAEGRRGSFSPEVDAALTAVAQQMDELPTKRSTVEGMTTPSSVLEAYQAVIDPLVDLVGLIPQGNDDLQLVRSVSTVEHLVKATELLARQQAQINSDLVSKQPFKNDDFRAALGVDSQRNNELDQFEKAATPGQKVLYGSSIDIRNNNDVVNTQKFTELVLNATVGQPLSSDGTDGVDSTKWLLATQASMDLSYGVADGIFGQIDSRVGDLRGGIQRGALLSALFTIAILAGALVTALIVAQSLIRPLFALRTAALDIAGRRLPDAVRRLRDSSEQDIDYEIEPVGINTDEEIGEVARAFDAVHREAVRLASEQAVLRNNVNAMFVNLSRRSQGLVERQLRLIDDLENREQDPDQLANLFKLDHLATRMRRNNESLLVLAGTDTARRWTHPVPLNEVVLAAISEVEQYTRVKQTTAAGVSIAGNGVSDVVHLIAELLENATSYSPPVTDVVVSSHSLGPGAGAMIEIVDQGIGMPAKELERANERLATPPVVDVSVSRTMGLFAVGRLASRHGIRVQLRESPSRGITAVVRLPAKLVTGDGGAAGPGAGRPAALGRPPMESLPRQVTASRAQELNGSGAPGDGGFGSSSGPMPMLGAGSGGPAGPGASNGRRPSDATDGLLEEMTDPNRFGPPTGPMPGGEPKRFGARPGATGPQPLLEPGRFGSGEPQRFGSGPAPAPDRGRPGGSDDYPDQRVPGQMFREQGRPDEGRDQREPPAFDRDDRSRPGQDQTGPGRGGGSPQSARGGETPGPNNPATAPIPLDRRAPGAAGSGRDLDGWTQEISSRQIPADPTDRTDDQPQIPQIPRLSGPNGFAPRSRQAAESAASDHNVFSRPAHRPEPEPVPAPAWSTDDSEQSGAFEVHASAEDTGEIHLDQNSEEIDTTPIFDSVSAWFQRRTPAPGAAPDRRQVPVPVPEPVVETAAPSRAFAAPRATGRTMGTMGGGLPTRSPARAPMEPLAPGQHQPAQHQPAPPQPAPPQRPAAAAAAAYQQPEPVTRQGPGSFDDQYPTGPQRPQVMGVPPRETSGSPRETSGQRAMDPPTPAPVGARSGGDGAWSSAGDAGWRAAEAARQPAPDTSVTRSGLPMRVPMTHLVPGSAEPTERRRPVDTATRSPEAVGGRLASFYQGVRQARDVSADTTRSARGDGQEER